MFGHDDNDHDENNNPGEEIVQPSDTATPDDGWKHPGPPPTDDDDDSNDTPDDKPAEPTPPPAFHLGDSEDTPTSTSGGHDNDDLIDLKQEALTKLSPLVGHLDQSPDEKFRTLMMMIQASDDQSLVRQAYETALSITDEKERAQALLDIVNEINYFTQNGGNGGS